MRSRNNNKGAVELSLNLIIMLIIGMVVLGLVIGFVSNLIGQGGDALDDQLSQAEAREKQNVLDEPGIFAVGPDTFKVSSGGNQKIFVKIYNPTNGDLSLTAESGSIKDSSVTVSGGGGEELVFKATSIDLDTTCEIQLQTTPITINSKDKQVLIASISPGTNCNPGESFFVSVEFTPEAGVTKTAQLSGEITS